MPALAPLLLSLLLQDAKAPELTARLHEVGDLLAVARPIERDDPPHLDLCPKNHFERGEQWDEFEPIERSESVRLDVNDLCDLVVSFVRPDGTQEFSIDAEGTALRVKGDANVHALVDRILEGMRAALRDEDARGQEQHLEVRVIAGNASEIAGPLLLDVARADERERTTGRAALPVLRFDRVSVPSGRTAKIHDVDEESYVGDFEVEIAHGAEIYDPIILSLSTGLTASARVRGLKGAALVDLAVRYTEPASPIRERTLSPKLWLTSPLSIRSDQASQQDPNTTGGTIVTGPIPLRLQLPATRFIGCAGSFVIPEGKALWLPCAVVTQSGRVTFILDVRAAGPRRGGVHRLAPVSGSTIDGFILRASDLDRSRLETRRFDRQSLNAAPLHADETWMPSFVSFQRFPTLDVASGVQAIIKAREENVAYWFTELPEGMWMVRAGSPLADATIHAIEEAFCQPVEPPQSIELRGRITDGDATLADFALPLIEGRTSTLWSGETGAYLVDWDVDVAGDTAIANPTVSTYFDGVALKFRFDVIGEKRLQVLTKGVLNFLESPPTQKSLESPYAPFIEDIRARRLFISEARTVSDDGATIRLRLGGAPLALELTLTRK